VSNAALTRAVKTYALELGFDAVGVADLSPVDHAGALVDWLEHGMAGTMRYMHRQADKRLHPAKILPGADRAIVVVKNHFSRDPARRVGTGRVAKFARGPDYHRALAAPLEKLTLFVRSAGAGECTARWFVDAGPVPERELAQRAGLGWLGKNTMLINPRLGSFTFLATVLTNLELDVDEPFNADRCGTCHRCIKACPTTAFAGPRVLDARRCISYITIEHKGDVAADLRRLVGDWIFGCDICQDVCPWNRRFAREPQGSGSDVDRALAQLDLEWLARIDEAIFRQTLGGTAMTRPSTAGMRRNALVAIENHAKEAQCQTSSKE
jgi:epoxyqueuosine reductase